MEINTMGYEWDYRPYVTNGDYYGTQEDWNQTILVRFNQMVADDESYDDF